jgi:hypothetical protein
MQVYCPHCNTKSDLPDEYKGKEVKCLTCKESFTLGESVTEPAQPKEVIKTEAVTKKSVEKKNRNLDLNLMAYLVLLILVIAVLANVYLWLSFHRYYLAVSDKGTAYEIDRLTGQTWFLHGNHKDPIEETPKGGIFDDIIRQMDNTKSIEETP